jgi:hypothetical protein
LKAVSATIHKNGVDNYFNNNGFAVMSAVRGNVLQNSFCTGDEKFSGP